MRHDLEAINAVMRLGDEFIPPVGTIFELVLSSIVLELRGLTSDRRRIRYNIVKLDRLSSISVDTFYLLLVPRGQITSVPEDALPFDIWERLK